MDNITINDTDEDIEAVKELMLLDGADEGAEILSESADDGLLGIEELEEQEKLDGALSQEEDNEQAPKQLSGETVRVVSIAFRNDGKRLYHAPENINLHIGDNVIVETLRGLEMGVITMPAIDFPKEKVPDEPYSIIRVANAVDLDQEAENRMKEREAFLICRQKIGEHGLEMKLVQSEYTFDRNKLIFYFTADGRVDFRELLKDLASTFHTRIELRQIGVRDETKVLGGIGVCGRQVCCRAYLRTFAPVSVKMAKEQNLSLNPTKISGICGRLMCCLKNEEETYEYLNRAMPRLGSKVATKDGEIGVVKSIDILKQKASVLFEEEDEREMRVYDVNDLMIKSHRGKSDDSAPNDNDSAFEPAFQENNDQEKPEERRSRDQSDRRGRRRQYDKGSNNRDGFDRGSNNRDSFDTDPRDDGSAGNDRNSNGAGNERNDKNGYYGKNRGRRYNKGDGGRRGGRYNKERREGGRPSEERPSDNPGQQ